MRSLEGTKVIDLSSLMAGPYCSMLLADMGAEVIKVEHPRGGDPVRLLGPPFTNRQSCLFLSLNRNKKGLALDLGRSEGQMVLYRLIEKADVVLENFLPGVVDRMGINYDTISNIRPEIIYCSISPFGPQGPLQNKPGTDPIFQGMGGVMMINGRPSMPPIRIGFPVADITAGIFAAFAITSSLFSRERSGKGKKLDISIFHALLALQTPRIAEFLGTGKNPRRLDRSSAFATPSQYFETLDGYVNVSAFSNKFWKKLCFALGLNDLAEDQNFSTPEKRMVNSDRLLPALEQVFRKKTTSEWMEILDSEEIPNGPIYDYEQMFNDEALRIAEYLVEFIHPLADKVKSMGLPLKTYPLEEKRQEPSPLLGQDTDEILGSLGFSLEEVDLLKEKQIVKAAGEKKASK